MVMSYKYLRIDLTCAIQNSYLRNYTSKNLGICLQKVDISSFNIFNYVPKSLIGEENEQDICNQVSRHDVSHVNLVYILIKLFMLSNKNLMMAKHFTHVVG